MGFRLTDDERAFQDTVRRYCEDQYQKAVPRRAFNGDLDAAKTFMDGLFELGVGGMLVAPEHGGLGLRLTDAALVAETLGHFAMPGPFIGHALSGFAISQYGTAHQKEEWLPRLSSGDCLATIAIHEPQGRVLPDELAGAPGPDGRLSGDKKLVVGASRADLIIVLQQRGGIALVETTSPGVRIEVPDLLDRTRPAEDVIFSEAAVQEMEGGGANLFDAYLLLLSADSFGGAQRVLEMTADYVRERRQFDRTIADFQAVRHELANLACEIECCRGLYWYGIAAFDAGVSDRTKAAARAKSRLTDSFNSICRAAAQLHGGIGMTWEYNLQLWLKRAMLNYALGGVPSRHRQRSFA
ncbi:MAG: acyl-CoA dehydrogenase family protein [Parvibaculaceae bacterium]